MKLVLAGCTAALFSLGVARADTTVFQDNFDNEGPPGSTENFNGFTQWTVTDGTVDLVANGDFGITCPGDTGKCVDLDGSTDDAGIMTSKSLNLAAGSYVLSFDYTGNQRLAPDDTFSAQLGSLFDTGAITVGSAVPLTHFVSSTITVSSPTTVSLVVGTAGGDNFGPLFDNVVLTQLTDPAPEPASWAMMILGFAFLGRVWRRRTHFA
jgi:PEP-CTERM motif